MGKEKSESQANISSLRQKAVDDAWAAELELVRQGKGTRQWTAEEQKELLATGKVEGYYGHHMQSVKTNPENAGNGQNIQFLNYEEHIMGAHQGNPREVSTNGYYDPKTGQMHEFQDNQFKPIEPMDLEEQAFDNPEDRENAYKAGLCSRYDADRDKKLVNFEKQLNERDDLTEEQKAEKLDNRALKYENDKEKFHSSVYEQDEKITNDTNNVKSSFNDDKEVMDKDLSDKDLKDETVGEDKEFTNDEKTTESENVANSNESNSEEAVSEESSSSETAASEASSESSSGGTSSSGGSSSGSSSESSGGGSSGSESSGSSDGMDY